MLFLAGCAGLKTKKVSPAPEMITQEVSGLIEKDTVWQGNILVTETVEVGKGVTLRIMPGARINFLVKEKKERGFGVNQILH